MASGGKDPNQGFMFGSYTKDKCGNIINPTLINIHNATNVNTTGKMVVNIHKEDTKRIKQRKPKLPLIAKQETLSIEQKLTIKDRLGRDWKDLGRRLEFDDGELDQLEHEHHRNYSELNYAILRKWEERAPEKATQANIAKVFEKLGRGDLADLLHEDDTPQIEFPD